MPEALNDNKMKESWVELVENKKEIAKASTSLEHFYLSNQPDFHSVYQAKSERQLGCLSSSSVPK